ncbi:MAG TPA: PhzF family phenazine biosynthesis protein [Vicinamibacterales bacterium]|jgi:trans-2,3-dihydro-3-hydroxyanthranilate isomerase|nr:PhzF family phenazine biosynthesis protein [Vicinamibacterales bacterium]
MRSYRYLHLDVFTDRALEGNQLAVFPDPSGLTADLMQAITREMNFSECTFILPPETSGTHIRMRIFTPGEELPMAGHPTIGSTFALVREGVIRPGQDSFVFGLGVGPTPVSLEWKDGALDFAWMTQGIPRYGASIADRAGFARAIGVDPADLGETEPQLVSCGNAFLIAPLTSRAAVDAVALDPKAYAAVSRAAGIDSPPLFIFTTAADASADDAAVYSRMLAPGFGISEDPATGSAAGPLGCYLFRHRLLPEASLGHFVSRQGVKMLRPSRLHVSIDTDGDAVTRVRVGGRSVLVGEGTLTV